MAKDKGKDFDLDRLSGLKAPKIDIKKRDEAIHRAQEFFEQTQKNSAATQRMDLGGRLRTVIEQFWRHGMNRKFASGTALATIMLIGFGGYYGAQYYGKGQTPQPDQIAMNESTLSKGLNGGDVADIKQDDQMVIADALQPSEAMKPQVESEVMSTLIGRTEKKPMSSSGLGQADVAQAPLSKRTAEVSVGNKAGKSSVYRVSSTVYGDWGGEPPLMLEQEIVQGRFPQVAENALKIVTEAPVSTFSIDVDTASYAFVRRSLESGQMPDPQAVRVEEMVNYFPYDWPKPEDQSVPFRTTVTLMPTPWKQGTELMHVAIQGYDVDKAEAADANLVFLIDVSGSMSGSDRLPLLKTSLKMLLNQLKPTDKVSIVTYAGSANTALKSTKVAEKQKIIDAIDRLVASGSTAGGEGLKTAYTQARKNFIKGGVNRIFLASDGDFNVGASSDEEMKSLVEKERKDGIYLSVLGFGMGNYQDALMQTLAQNGNGVAAYIDNLSEARKVLVEEAGGNLFTIAKDVKIQVEFNPEQIAEYRLIGYETRALKREDFNNDKVDAGDIGSGHRVTAIYEVTPKDSPARLQDDLRYQSTDKPAKDNGELAYLRIRYKQPDSENSQLIETPVTKANFVETLDAAPNDVRFSVAVAAFGQKLKQNKELEDYSYDQINNLAVASKGKDPFGYRAGFINLVNIAKSLAQ